MNKTIKLTDGTFLDIGVNFYTQYLMINSDIQKIQKKLDKNPKDEKLMMQMGAELIYIILRSNGKTVDKEEAMRLTPFDFEEIELILKEFMDRLEYFKKKQENKQQMKNM